MLEEDLGLLTVPLSLLALWALTQVGDHPGVPGRKDRPIPNSNAIDAINDMWENKPFIKDFAKILSDEGDIEKIADLVKSVKKSNKDSMPVKERIWQLINSTDFQPQPTAKRIVQKLLKTSSYKGIVRKYNLTKEDEQYFAKLLLFTIMRPEFTRYAMEYILKTVKPLGIFSKMGKYFDSSRKIDGYTLSSPSAR